MSHRDRSSSRASPVQTNAPPKPPPRHGGVLPTCVAAGCAQRAACLTAAQRDPPHSKRVTAELSSSQRAERGSLGQDGQRNFDLRHALAALANRNSGGRGLSEYGWRNKTQRAGNQFLLSVRRWMDAVAGQCLSGGGVAELRHDQSVQLLHSPWSAREQTTTTGTNQKRVMRSPKKQHAPLTTSVLGA
ncbi:hypothetical protein AOLI_G00100660 [Acnodon oligacanthus]